MEQLKKFSPAIFVLIILCYLLPFYDLSFSGQKIASVTGLQIVTNDGWSTGKNMEIHYALGHIANSATYKFEGGGSFAIVVLLVAFIGLAISYTVFKKMSNKSLLSMIVSIIGVVLFYLIKNDLDHEIIAFEKGRLFLEYDFGYWLVLLLLIASAVIQIIIFNQEKKLNSVKL